MKLRSVTEADVSGKRVLLRAGLNVPVAKGAVTDTFRIARARRTLTYLRERGARIILISHLGRSGETLRPVFEELHTALGGEGIVFSEAAPGSELLVAVENLRDGDILMLDNIRRFEGEERNDDVFARALASAAELFVNDAFADSHRAHASIVGVSRHLPSYAGLLLAEEVAVLEEARAPLSPSVAIVGGAKFETKEPLIGTLLERYEKLLLGGALANDFFKARGFEIGTSLSSPALVPEHLLTHEKLLLPVDVVAEREGVSRVASAHEVSPGERIADVGPRTVHDWLNALTFVETVLWNGPLGIYEKGFCEGTDALAAGIVRSGARAIIGGGDTIAALSRHEFDPERIFLSTGGGAMLEFLVHATLPGLEPLRAA